jgi:hypothetical protein
MRLHLLWLGFIILHTLQYCNLYFLMPYVIKIDRRLGFLRNNERIFTVYILLSAATLILGVAGCRLDAGARHLRNSNLFL